MEDNWFDIVVHKFLKGVIAQHGVIVKAQHGDAVSKWKNSLKWKGIKKASSRVIIQMTKHVMKFISNMKSRFMRIKENSNNKKCRFTNCIENKNKRAITADFAFMCLALFVQM